MLDRKFPIKYNRVMSETCHNLDNSSRPAHLRVILDYMLRHDLSQERLAEKLSITAGYLSQILSGDREPGLQLALRMEEIIDVPAQSWKR